MCREPPPFPCRAQVVFSYGGGAVAWHDWKKRRVRFQSTSSRLVSYSTGPGPGTLQKQASRHRWRCGEIIYRVPRDNRAVSVNRPSPDKGSRKVTARQLGVRVTRLTSYRFAATHAESISFGVLVRLVSRDGGGRHPPSPQPHVCGAVADRHARAPDAACSGRGRDGQPRGAINASCAFAV